MPQTAVLDSYLHHEEYGEPTDRPTYVLLHGNPGSSRSWRHVAPVLAAGGRVLAPDLIGMGGSGKPELGYSFADHARYLDAWFEAMDMDRVVLVCHDWGGALGFDWASRHPERVAGVAFFEAVIRPLGRDELSPQALQRTLRLRSPEGDALIDGEENGLIRGAFTQAVLTPLAEDDLAAFLAPYPTPASRRPLLAWARQIPVDGDPAELIPRLEAYQKWLGASAEVPKLLLTFTGSPTVATPAVVQWCATHVAGLTTVPCGEAGHHATEDRPAEIAAAVGRWAAEHGVG